MGAHRPGGGAEARGRGDRLTQTQVCRVQPDVAAIHRAFDYEVPESLAADVRVGTVVRVPLHGRRVRGWVLDADVDQPETPRERLRPLTDIVSAGPPADLVQLCRWAAWRWAGPLATFLRAASPANRVAAIDSPELETAVYPELPGAANPWRGDALILIAPTNRPEVPLLIAPEGSTLVIDPSPVRAAQLAAALLEEGREVVTVGSEHSDAHRTSAWDRARAGACVVVGGRTAVWAPVPDVSTIVVVDESDEALEDERAPTWNARDVVVERSRRSGATIRLVTPAPTIDAVVAVGESVAAGAREARAPRWPRVEVVDLRDEAPGHGLLSAALADALRRTVDRGERAVCVLNRTGRARLLACNTCRELARCERCGATVQQLDAEFVCAQCATVRPQVCLHCHGSSFRVLRPGIARVRDDLAALLPHTQVAAVDAKTSPTTGVDDAPVVVGTEAVFHRVNTAGAAVGLVAYLEFDQELLAPRARAAEQALWLLVRGGRLLARREHGAPAAAALLVQTRLPDHEVVRAAVDSDPMLVTDAEAIRRRTLGFPPFGGLAELSGATAAVAAACSGLAAVDGVSVLGPVERAPRAGSAAGSRALVKAPTIDALCDALADPAVDHARTLGRLRIDVDPRRV